MKNTATLKIAKKYAEALAAIKLDEKLITELDFIAKSFTGELRTLLKHPKLKNHNKQEVINKIFAGQIDPDLLKLLHLLLERRRIDIAPFLGAAYRESYNNCKRIARACITSATKLSDSELSTIRAELETLFKKTIVIETSEDPSLIAGQSINVSGTIIDNSIQSKLKQMRKLLK